MDDDFDPQVCCPTSASDYRHRECATTEDEELAALAKALAHPTRIQIVRLLLTKESCMCGDIVDELPFAQSTVSQHLKLLKEAGIIRGEVSGPRVCYCLEPLTLRRLIRLLEALGSHAPDRSV